MTMRQRPPLLVEPERVSTPDHIQLHANLSARTTDMQAGNSENGSRSLGRYAFADYSISQRFVDLMTNAARMDGARNNFGEAVRR